MEVLLGMPVDPAWATEGRMLAIHGTPEQRVMVRGYVLKLMPSHTLEVVDRGHLLTLITGVKRLPSAPAPGDEQLCALTAPLLTRLVAAARGAMIVPQRPDFSMTLHYPDGSTRTLTVASQSGGFTMPFADDQFKTPDVAFFDRPRPSNALVVFDASGTVYTVPGDGGAPVADPTAVILWHELFHGDEVTRGTAIVRKRTMDERAAVSWENQVRASIGLARRALR